MEKKDAAKVLYLDGMEQRDIAQLLRIQESTLSRWQTAEGWKEQRIRKNLRDATIEDNVKDALDYQFSVLKSEIKRNQTLPLEERKLINAGAIDGIQKLFTTIKRSELKWSDMVKIIRQFLAYVSEQDAELAKQLMIYSDQYINDKRDNL